MEIPQIEKMNWARAATAFYWEVMKRTDSRSMNVETENQLYLTSAQAFHQAFTVLDDAYRRSQASMETKPIGDLDDERDIYGMVMENVAKQWMRLPNESMAVRGRRVAQVFKDLDFRASEAITAENGKIFNMEQRFAEAQLVEDLAAMGLTAINTELNRLTQLIETKIGERDDEKAERVKGELKAARDAMDTAYQNFVKMVNALVLTGAASELEPLVAQLNSAYQTIEEQIKQSKSMPTVLVDSKVVGNHRYSVPEFATWQTIVDQNEKAFAVATDGSNRIISLATKASKVGGLYLTLNGVAVKPTDAVDAKKKYALANVKPQPEPTPVEPE